MKLSVFEEKKVEKPKKEFSLRLVKGRIMVAPFSFSSAMETKEVVKLVAVDKDGNPYSAGNILYFNDNGTVTRCTDVDPELGFQLDELGRVKICD